MAQLVSQFAQDVLGLVPDTTRSCEFSDIGYLTEDEQQAIKDACMLNILGVHKNGIAIKTLFEPGKYIDEKEFAAALSRTIYDGTYNLELDSPVSRYVNHVTQIRKIGLLPAGPQVMLSFAVKAFETIKNDLSMVKRADFSTHAAAIEPPVATTPVVKTGATKTGATVTTAPATPVGESLRALLESLKDFFLINTSTLEEIETEDTVQQEPAHGAAEQENVAPSPASLRSRSFIDFMQLFQ